MKWLEKATFTTPDITFPAGGGLLSPEQALKFIRVAIDASTLLPEVNNITSGSPKFEAPRISFGSRILRPGTQGARLLDADRVKPTTGLITLSTAHFKGEVPVADEVFEDNIERDSLADTIMTMIAEAVGRDIEEIAIKSDTARDPGGADPAADAVLDQLDGLIKQAQTLFPVPQRIDATTVVSYDDLFSRLVEALPSRYRRDYPALRFYVPTRHRDGYQKELAGRGTGLGDQILVESMATKLAFRGIPVREVPLLGGPSTVNGAPIDYGKFAILTHPLNVYAGWHRKVRVERWRDPRDGATSFLPSVRVDFKYADPEFGTLAFNIPL